MELESLNVLGVYLIALFGFFFAGCVCCGVTCAACSGTVPATYSVTIAGVTDSACINCAAFNSTYVVAYVDCVITGNITTATWNLGITNHCFVLSAFPMSNSAVTVRVQHDTTGAGTRYVEGHLSGTEGGFGREILWTTVTTPAATPEDCDAFSALSLAYVADSLLSCNTGGGTATFTIN